MANATVTGGLCLLFLPQTAITIGVATIGFVWDSNRILGTNGATTTQMGRQERVGGEMPNRSANNHTRIASLSHPQPSHLLGLGVLGLGNEAWYRFFIRTIWRRKGCNVDLYILYREVGK
jgi:hypothetical protein